MRSKLALPVTLALIPIALLALASCQQAGGSAGSIDLAPGTITYSGSSVAWGSTLDVSLPITNSGSGSTSTSFDVKFYAATSSTFNPSSDGPPVGTIAVAGIGGSTTVTESATLTMPSAPSTGTNEDVYIYADVDPSNATGDTNTSNNISTVTNAGIVLAYDSGVTQASRSYKVMIETYGTTGGSSNPGIALYSYSSGLTFLNASTTSGTNTYNSLNYTSTTLPAGTYYVTVFPLLSGGSYAFNVRTTNVTSPTFTALTSDPPGATNVGNTTDNTVSDQFSYNPYSGAVPTKAQVIKVGNALNWYLASGDANDWFTFTLP